jgi:predicted Rossmann-fold nucleotide-binding protein
MTSLPVDLLASPPFNPVPAKLYTSSELLVGLTRDDPLSMVRTPDYLSYIYFQQQGRTTVRDPYAAMMEAMHDASIVRGMDKFLQVHLGNGRRPVAIMGGHREPRGSKTYRAVARMAQRLSEEGFIVASGGGPGCMEASHLGALFATASIDELTQAIDRLEQAAPTLPETMKSVLVQDDNTKAWSINEENARQLAAWMLPAWEIAQERLKHIGTVQQSLAVPTWHYGHEPLTPLSTHVAKFFLNSIREDVLLALASSGIVYSEGRGGTLQEVFQHAGQVYYREKDAPIRSMIFFDSGFWTAPATPDTRVHLPVRGLLSNLFVDSKNMTQEQFDRFVSISDDPDATVDKIIANAPPVEHVMSALRQIGVPAVDTQMLDAAAARMAASVR